MSVSYFIWHLLFAFRNIHIGFKIRGDIGGDVLRHNADSLTSGMATLI